MARGRLRRGCSLEVILEEDSELIFGSLDNSTRSIDSLDSFEYPDTNSSDSLRSNKEDSGTYRRARSVDYLMEVRDMDSMWDLNSSYEEELAALEFSPDDSTYRSPSPRLDPESPATRARISRRQIVSTWCDRETPWHIDPPVSVQTVDNSTPTIQQVKSLFESRQHVITGSFRRKNSIDSSTVASSAGSASQYLGDYDAPDLLVNKNVVIVETRQCNEDIRLPSISVGGFWPPPAINDVDVLRMHTRKAQTLKRESKNDTNNNSSEKAKCNTIGWRPRRLRNKEIVDTEMPKPDTVRNVRNVFENILVFKPLKGNSNEDSKQNKITAVKSNPRSKILRSDSFEDRKNKGRKNLVKSQSVENFVNQIPSSPLKEVYIVQDNKIRNAKDSKLNHANRYNKMMPSTNCQMVIENLRNDTSTPNQKSHIYKQASKQSSVSAHSQPADLKKSNDQNKPTVIDSLTIEKSPLRPSVSVPCLFNSVAINYINKVPERSRQQELMGNYSSDDEYMTDKDDDGEDDIPRFIPKDVLERIRSCGTSVTYFGGKVVSSSNRISSKKSESDINSYNESSGKSSPLNNGTLRANLNNIFNNHASIGKRSSNNNVTTVTIKANNDMVSKYDGPRIVSVVPKNSPRITPTSISNKMGPMNGFSDSDEDRESSSRSFDGSTSPTQSLSSSPSPLLLIPPIPPRGTNPEKRVPVYGQHSVVFNFTSNTCNIKAHVPQIPCGEDEEGVWL